MTGVPRARPSRWYRGRLAWGLWALAILGLVVTVWLDQLLRRAGRAELVVLTPAALPPVLGAVSAATVGAVLASRRPRHPVGWLLLVFGLSLCAAGVGVAYANYGVAHTGTPAAGLVAPYVPATIVAAVACRTCWTPLPHDRRTSGEASRGWPRAWGRGGSGRLSGPAPW